jgi:tetratricopeptide (TPR) repeat protein
MGDDQELEYIETLDDLSRAIQTARESIEGPQLTLNRRASIQVGWKVTDVLEAAKNHQKKTNGGRSGGSGVEDSVNSAEMQGARSLLESWQTLVETLFAQKVFLRYAPQLEICIGKLSLLAHDNVIHVRCLVEWMKHAVEYYKIHECTELRYVTLLEVMMSYSVGWVGPSPVLKDLWARLGQKAPITTMHSTTNTMENNSGMSLAIEFRRQAYQVLVSLPWIPSSHGLYRACSMDEDDSIHSDLPLCIRTKLDRLGMEQESCLLRSDLIHFVLHKIRRNTTFRVVLSCATQKGDPSLIGISSSDVAGVGKTTLAALLAANPTLASKYSIVWVDLPTTVTEEERPVITYEQYMKCLESICQQLSVTPNWPERILRLENSLIRIRREKEFMTRAKNAMTRLLQRTLQQSASSDDNNKLQQKQQTSPPKQLLVVMDDIRDEKEFELFNFLEQQSSIVMTQSTKVPRTTCTMKLEPLSEDEALHLFAVESDFHSDTASVDPSSASASAQTMLRTYEAKSIVDQCRRHPLVVRTAARWFKVKQVSSGMAKALEELTLELSILRHNSLAKTPIAKVLAEVMNIMLSPVRRQGGQPTKIMKLCLASFAVVFAQDVVCLDAVVALWCQVIASAPPAREELGSDYSPADLAKRAWFTAEIFIQLGIFDLTQTNGIMFVNIYHQMYLNYGVSVLSEVGSLGITVEDLKAKWHEKFVVGYNERRRITRSLKLEDTVRSYALEKLVHHSIEAKSIPKVVEILRDEKFYKERIAVMGYRQATSIHINDCLMLQRKAKESKAATPVESRKVVLSVLKKMASVLAEDTTPMSDDQKRVEKAVAVHHVGFTQADNKATSEALTQYKAAMQLVPSPSHPFNAIVMYSQAVLHLMRNDHDKAMKKVKGCQKVLKETADRETSTLPLLHLELIQLKGDALAAACDYQGAATCYEDALNQMKAGSKIETGTALFRRGRLHQMMGELNLASSALDECLTWKMDLGETCSTNLAEAYKLVGDLSVELEEEDKALQNFERALEVLTELEEEAPEVDILLLQGKIASLRGDIEGSKTAFEEARKLITKSPTMLMDHSAYELRCIAQICMDRGETAETVELLEESLQLTLDRLDSLERGCILYDLGQCMFVQDEYQEAMACFEESLEIRKKALGDCELVLETLSSLGEAYKKLDMGMQRLGASQQVLELTQRLFRRDDEKVAGALFGVGEAQEALKANADAGLTYIQCRDLLQRALPRVHPDIANVLQRLANLYASQQDFEKAHANYLEALDIRTACRDPEHPELAETFFLIGVVTRRLNDLEGARDHLLDALNIQKKLELANETCATLIELGTVYRLMKEPDSAISCYERCINLIEPSAGLDTLIGRVYLELGHAKLFKNEFVDAMDCYERCKFWWVAICIS